MKIAAEVRPSHQYCTPYYGVYKGGLLTTSHSHTGLVYYTWRKKRENE